MSWHYLQGGAVNHKDDFWVECVVYLTFSLSLLFLVFVYSKIADSI